MTILLWNSFVYKLGIFATILLLLFFLVIYFRLVKFAVWSSNIFKMQCQSLYSILISFRSLFLFLLLFFLLFHTYPTARVRGFVALPWWKNYIKKIFILFYNEKFSHCFVVFFFLHIHSLEKVKMLPIFEWHKKQNKPNDSLAQK